MADKAVLVPLFAERAQDLFILNWRLAASALRLVQSDVARFAVRPAGLHDEGFGQHRCCCCCVVRISAATSILILSSVERLGVDEGVATL